MSDHVDDLAIALGLVEAKPSFPSFMKDLHKQFEEVYGSPFMALKQKLTPEDMNKLGYLGEPAPILGFGEAPSPTKEEFYGENEEEEDEEDKPFQKPFKDWNSEQHNPAPPDHLLKNWHFHSMSASPVSLHVKNINHMTQEEAYDKVQEILENAMQIKLILSDKGGIHYDCFISVHPEHVLIQDFKAK